MKFQVNLFFIVSIMAMILKLFSGLIEDIISYKNRDSTEISLFNSDFHKFFWIGVMNLISDLSFSGLIISYLVSIGNRERDITKQSKLDNKEED